jgi:hypothetical protein
MNILELPIEIQFLIIDNYQCCNVCKKWELLLKQYKSKLIINKAVENNNIYVVKYHSKHYPKRVLQQRVIDIVSDNNDEILLKCIIYALSNISQTDIRDFSNKINTVLLLIITNNYCNIMEYILLHNEHILIKRNEYSYGWTYTMIHNICRHDKLKMLDMMIKTNEYFTNICITKETKSFNASMLINALKDTYLYDSFHGRSKKFKGFGTKYHDILKEFVPDAFKYSDLTLNTVIQSYFECIKKGLYNIIDHFKFLSELHECFNLPKYYPLLYVLSSSESPEDAPKYIDYDNPNFEIEVNNIIQQMNAVI